MTSQTAVLPGSGANAAPFEVEPIGPTIGAEIHGLDLREEISEAAFAAFEAAVIEHKVVYARDQHIDTAQHVALGKRFGELEVHPFRPEGAFPEIMVLDNHKDNPVLSTDVWHSDTTFRECPTRYSILRCLEIPKVGGDTLWADMTAAYDGLSDTMKAFIDPLFAVHDFKNFRALYTSSEEDRAKLARMEKLYPNPTHPVVRTHPVSGRRAIYVNPQFTLRIEGLNADESDSLLKLLYEQAHVPEYQFRLRWKPGTIVFWDNRSTQHYAANDYYPNRRHMERVAVVGEKPV
ncbi:MAG: taurine dioxygenase [Alphaproteobacteria bacterium]|nr:taurine dioxygenase [Alphaproteobacteria bacterium]